MSLHTSLPLPTSTRKNASHLNSIAAYTAPYPPHPPSKTHIDKTHIRHFHTAWTPTDFIYTDGSQIKGKPTLGASVVDPKHNTTTHIEIKSQPERYTINIAELATITTALDLHRHDLSLSILTDNAFGISNLRNFSSQPHAFNHHQHKELLKLADNVIRERDLKGYTTHIGKVRSHNGVVYNDGADESARSVIDGKTRPDITFTEADPPPYEACALGHKSKRLNQIKSYKLPKLLTYTMEYANYSKPNHLTHEPRPQRHIATYYNTQENSGSTTTYTQTQTPHTGRDLMH